MVQLPGSSGSPTHVARQQVFPNSRCLPNRALTSFVRLRDGLVDGTSRRLVRRLALELGALVVAAPCVESPLQRVVLPAEDVVAVLAVPSSMTLFLSASNPYQDFLISSHPLMKRKIKVRETHPSPMLYTNGCPPSSGQISGLLNCRVSHIISYISCGSLTG